MAIINGSYVRTLFKDSKIDLSSIIKKSSSQTEIFNNNLNITNEISLNGIKK